jgi:hypothetical protein
MTDLPPNRRPSVPETRAYINASGEYVRERPGVRTTITADDDIMKWATAEYVSQAFLDKMAHLRNQEKRAPRGESRGEWQLVGEYPMSWFMNQLPKDAWEDKKALAKIINDGDMRKFRADGNTRRF